MIKMKISLSKLVRKINWFGVIAGILMIVLPFAGMWWRFTVGTGAIELTTSPFGITTTAFGQTMESTLARYIFLGATIGIIIAGLFVLFASLLPEQWWSARLMDFGATKVFWMAISLVMSPLIGAFIVNKILPGGQTLTIYILGAMISIVIAVLSKYLASKFLKKLWSKRLMKLATNVLWMIAGVFIVLAVCVFIVGKYLPSGISSIVPAGGTLNVNVPYVSGSASTIFSMNMGGGQATLTLPISMGLMSGFALAIITAVFSILAWIYHPGPPEEKKKK
jgi:MFS family permease